jgi:hypothetical protein
MENIKLINAQRGTFAYIYKNTKEKALRKQKNMLTVE